MKKIIGIILLILMMSAMLFTAVACNKNVELADIMRIKRMIPIIFFIKTSRFLFDKLF